MTAKGLGKSLLSQFENFSFVEYLCPYVNTESKVLELIEELKAAEEEYGCTPIIFASMMDDKLMQILTAKVRVIDIFQPFMATLEHLINEKSSKAVGRAHNAKDFEAYKNRVKAIDYTLATDDGLRLLDYDEGDVILLGVSRSGKTPTALYLALNFGLKVANYPFTADDLPHFTLKDAHKKNRSKLVGLTISPDRLISIRKERRADGYYADRAQVNSELNALQELFEREKIPFIDASTRSVEEIAASIMSMIFIKDHHLQKPLKRL